MGAVVAAAVAAVAVVKEEKDGDEPDKEVGQVDAGMETPSEARQGAGEAINGVSLVYESFIVATHMHT